MTKPFRWSEAELAARRKRALVLALALVAFAVLSFFVTLARMGAAL
ncbi:MAG: hypothetical protein OXB87_02755 [Hyphomicrobiales bacterium]|nr:hypothetical protein [Hyphomicrobiales bacterium]